MKNLTIFKCLSFLTVLFPSFLFAQTIEWAKMIDDKDVTIITTKTNTSGDLVILGTFTGTVDFDPGTGTTNLTSAGYSDIFIARYKSTGAISFAKRIGASYAETVYDLSVDGSNYIVISGRVVGQVDMDPGTGSTMIGRNGAATSFLAKYTSTGSFSWVKTFGGGASFLSITHGSSNKIIVAGQYTGIIDFNPSTASAEMTSVSSGNDMFIASYSSSGSYSWAKSIGNSNDTEKPFDVTTDADGNVYFTGVYKGTMDFDPSSSTANLSSTGSNANLFFAKYSSTGDYKKAKSIGGGTIEPVGIVVDDNSNVFIGGTFSNTVDFNASSTTNNVSSQGGVDVFVFKYKTSSSDLVYDWAKDIGGSFGEKLLSICLDANNNLLLYGEFGGVVSINAGNSGNDLVSAGAADRFFAKMSTTGNITYTHNIGNTDDDVAYSMAFDKANNRFYLTGDFGGSEAFSMGAIYGIPVTLLAPSSSKRTFIAKYSISNTSSRISNPEQTLDVENTGDEIATKLTSTIMPNPNQGQFSIAVNGFESMALSNIHVFDVTGKEMSGMYKVLINNTVAHIDATKFETGIYMIIIESNGTMIQEKFIKQ